MNKTTLGELGKKYENDRTWDNSWAGKLDPALQISHHCPHIPSPDTSHIGGDKFDGQGDFTYMYDLLMRDKRSDNINLLECGIFRGESMAVWCDYFSNGKIYGMDINLIPSIKYKNNLKARGAFRNNDYFAILGDNTALNTFKNGVGNIKFDFIIEDGCHHPDCVIKSIKNLLPFLKRDGILIVEDIVSSVELFKRAFPGLHQIKANESITDSHLHALSYNKFDVDLTNMIIHNAEH